MRYTDDRVDKRDWSASYAGRREQDDSVFARQFTVAVTRPQSWRMVQPEFAAAIARRHEQTYVLVEWGPGIEPAHAIRAARDASTVFPGGDRPIRHMVLRFMSPSGW